MTTKLFLLVVTAAILSMIVPLTNVFMVLAEDDGEITDDSSSDSGNSGDSSDDGSSDSGGGSTGTYEDDGDTETDPEKQKQLQQEYDDRNLPKYDPDTGTYNDKDNNGIDDDSKANDEQQTAQVPTTLVPPVGPENSPELKQCSDGTLATSCQVPTKSLPTCNDSDLQYQQRDCKTSYGTTCKMPSSNDACQSDKPANIRCSNGWLAETQQMCPTKEPYCDKFANGAAPAGKSCHDRKDYDQTTGLYPCNDGTMKADYKDCKDTSGYKYNKNNDNNNESPRISVQSQAIPPPNTSTPQDCETWSYTLDIKLAGLNATSQLLDSMYANAETNSEIDKYNAEIFKYNADVDIVSADVDRYNAECAT